MTKVGSSELYWLANAMDSGNCICDEHRSGLLRKIAIDLAVKSDVCAEVLRIMATYHEQEARGNVDTPGGLEHMGDVWQLLAKWEQLLKAEGK